jgi:arginase
MGAKSSVASNIASRHFTRRSLTTSDKLTKKLGGAGYGNVRDRVIPTIRPDRAQLYRHSADPHTATIIGAPMTYGQPYVGTDCGPALLREGGLRHLLSELGWRVEDLPDLKFESVVSSSKEQQQSQQPITRGFAKNSVLVGNATKQLADIVQQTLSQGKFPLVLGGDHSIALGSLSGILRVKPDTGILWVDAHADLNTPFISESGNMHGMPVGMLMDGVTTHDIHNVPGFAWLQDGPRLRPSQIAYVGLRDVDPAERQLIQTLGIAAFTMHDIDRYGIGHVMDMALDHLLVNNPDRPLHLSYDIDAVDPVLAPATGTTVRGGLTFREAHYVAEAVAQTGNLASADIVELNPTLSNVAGAEETVDLGLQIITSFMGKSII